jgi:hypothetical protein
MNYYEEAQKRLIIWIDLVPTRKQDFSVLSGGKTVNEYCAKEAYRPSIISDIVSSLCVMESRRVIAQING